MDGGMYRRRLRHGFACRVHQHSRLHSQIPALCAAASLWNTANVDDEDVEERTEQLLVSDSRLISTSACMADAKAAAN